MEQTFNIVQLFYSAVEKNPGRIAIVEKDKQVTFGELRDRVEATSVYFLSRGIRKGDRVLIFVPMSTDLYRIVLALFRIGATAVFLDEWVSLRRMEACCRSAQCQAFIGTFKARLLTFFSGELRKIPCKLGTGYKPVNGDHKPEKVMPGDTALITFTTGSTGTPKAARRTHGFLHEQFRALIEKIDPQPGDIDMPVLPIVLLINLGAGCTSVIAPFKSSKPETMNPAKITRQMEEYGVSRMEASPYFVRRLAEYKAASQSGLTSLKKIFTGGAPVFPAEAAIFRKGFPGASVEIVYGSTEAEPICSIKAEELMATSAGFLQSGLKAGAVCRPAEVKIISITDQPVSGDELNGWLLPAGQVGEIIVSGPHVLREYFNNKDALIRNKIVEGTKCWHRTGDSGYLNEEGVLFLMGRCNTLILRNGRILAPFIYENYFRTIPGIALGTLVDTPGGIIAVIEPETNANRDKIKSCILTGVHDIRRVTFLKKIPRDPRHYSKIDYEKLKLILK